MSLENVHVYTKDRVTNKATLTHVNPQRTWIRGELNAKGECVNRAIYVWHVGNWYGLGGNPINEKDVPEDVRAQAPPHVAYVDTELMAGPSITQVCKYCNETMNASQLDAHLYAHVDNLMRGAAASSLTELEDAVGVTPKKKAS